jgi:hypothetical protein
VSTVVFMLGEMPRSNMGKVNKKELLKTAFPQQ